MGIIKVLKLLSGKVTEQQTGDTVGPMTIATGTITRAAGAGSSTQVVTIGFNPSVVFFDGSADADSGVVTDGWDTGTIAQCTWSNDVTLLATILSTNNKSLTQSIRIQSALGAGHSALISAKSSSGFTLNWTQIGGGLATTIKYLAIY